LRPALIALAAAIGAAVPARGEDQLGVAKPQWGAFFSGHDQRVPMEPTAWPWQAIGRVNIVDRRVLRYCTGTLVGPRLVLTAGHCLYDHRVGGWINAGRVHFVAGQARDTFAGQSVASAIILPPDLDIVHYSNPGLHTISPEVMARDWALIVLESAIAVKPVPVKAIPARSFAQEVAAGEVARAGYGADRQYLLSVHRGCAVTLSERWPGAMLNQCDQRRGDSGSPVLLLRGEQEAFVIGLNAAAGHRKRGEEDYVALGALGPSATSFADAVQRALEH
jgi:protease YdgD